MYLRKLSLWDYSILSFTKWRPIDHFITTVQSSHKLIKLITGENYDDWAKSFPKNVKVETNTSVASDTPIVSDECQGWPYTYQPFPTKVKDSKPRSYLFQLPAEVDCNCEEILSCAKCIWSNILSTECEYHTY